MEPNKNSKQQAKKELLDAISHVWNRGLSFLNSMALKCAVELGISDAIKKHGKPMTLIELANSLSIHPNKASSLHQLMRLLVHSNVYTIQILGTREEAYDLTLNSELLLEDHPLTLAPLTRIGVTPLSTEPSHHLALWFRNQDQSCESPFQISQGMHLYKGMPYDTELNGIFNQAMASDSQLIANLLLASDEFEGLIHGVESLLDVGGGNGTMAKAIAKAYPKMNCIVFDQPHVVNELQVHETANLTYVAGDMFQAIPNAQVILLKWILHNWSDENCIKILKKCKEAIPSREKGGKLLIIDMVVGIPTDNIIHFESQLLADVHMLYLFGEKERTEQQWKSLFDKAGFCDYNILPILGSRSIIEVYPA
ncbi:trans-resveratrol di-O-methyltransferase-like [Chenopodium quinoa]|uniref:trans-resveratrol di-O-methyltransferase-like n=1 Tax=Chenopodium quinoa TaxID=63459 RepID=UPI000B76EB2B|nr:trans-resveratrol di-O-methyltransferase-like [Chenopodium quinoa]